MAGPATKPPKTVWTRFQADLARDPKKTGLMLVLVIVAAVIGVRTIGKHSTPAPAGAAVAVAPPRGLAGKAGAALADPIAARKGDEQERRETYLARMDRTISRDLFKTSPELFPATGGAAQEDSADGAGSWLGDMAEQLTQQQQAQRDRLDQMAAIRVQARALNLQGTMLGSTPTALINGQPMHVGGAIRGFVITEITPNACRLTREGVAVELRMKK